MCVKPEAVYSFAACRYITINLATFGSARCCQGITVRNTVYCDAAEKDRFKRFIKGVHVIVIRFFVSDERGRTKDFIEGGGGWGERVIMKYSLMFFLKPELFFCRNGVLLPYSKLR